MDAVEWRAPDDFGVTIPLLHALLDNYADRRRRELHEDAVAGALAHHDPKGIDALRQEREAEEDSDSEFDTPAWKE